MLFVWNSNINRNSAFYLLNLATVGWQGPGKTPSTSKEKIRSWVKPLVRARGKEHVFSGSQEGQNNSHHPTKICSTFEKQKQFGKIGITNGLGMRQVASYCTSRKSIGQCRHWFGHWLCWHHSHMLGKGRRMRLWGVSMAELAWLKDWMSRCQISNIQLQGKLGLGLGW